MPGVLVWAWDVLRPLYRSERLGKAIGRVIDAVEGDGRGFVAESLAPAKAAAVRNLLTAYDFGNAQNLIALKSLVLVLQGDLAVRAAPGSAGAVRSANRRRRAATAPAGGPGGRAGRPGQEDVGGAWRVYRGGGAEHVPPPDAVARGAENGGGAGSRR